MMYGTRMMSPAFIIPVPRPAKTWNPYCVLSIIGDVLIRESRTIPMISRMAPAITTQQGGILPFPMRPPAMADPMGIIAPKLRSLTAAERGDTLLTVTKRCGIWTMQTNWIVPARKVLLCLF
jgi:hypothetical protein